VSAKRYATVEDVNNDTSIQTGKECFDAALAEGAARERERLLKEHGEHLERAAMVLREDGYGITEGLILDALRALGGKA